MEVTRLRALLLKNLSFESPDVENMLQELRM